MVEVKQWVVLLEEPKEMVELVEVLPMEPLQLRLEKH